MDVENMNNLNSSSAECSPRSLRMEGRCSLIILRLLLECLEGSPRELAREVKKKVWVGWSLLSPASAGGEALLTTWWMLDNIFLCLISPQKLVLYRYLDFGSIYRLLCCVERWYFMDGVLISDAKIVSLCSVSSYFISRITTSVLISLALCKWTRLELFMVPALLYCCCLSGLEIICPSFISWMKHFLSLAEKLTVDVCWDVVFFCKRSDLVTLNFKAYY